MRERSVGTGTSPPTGVGGTGVTPEVLERLLPYLGESVMVLDADWNVKVNLAPPGGLIGRGLGLGVHTLEDMHPDDALKILDLGTQAYTTEPGWQGSMVVRMCRGDGTYAPYEITAVNRSDDPVLDGMVVRTREVVTGADADLPGLEGHVIETLAEVLPLGVVLLEGGGRPVFANRAACRLLRAEAEDVKREGLQRYLAPEDGAMLHAAVDLATSGRAGKQVTTLRLAGPRGGHVEITLVPQSGPAATTVVVTLEDVTERRAAQRDLEHRANHDELTGLRNRASVLDLLRRHLAAGEPVVVAYVDLDGFKTANDRLGHAGGDTLLVAVAGALRADLDDALVVARLGGDEFVVVGTGLDPAAEGALARRLEALVADLPEARAVDVTCSVGTGRSRPGDTPRDLLHRADQAMYAHKSHRAV